MLPLVIVVFALSRMQSVVASFAVLRHAAFAIAMCAAFMVIGPALMLLNKHIMQAHAFRYPLSLSGLGVLASTLFSRASVALGFAEVRKESREVVAGAKWFRTALPVGACKALSLATGNAAYLHLGVGFIQMLKAFTPAIVMAVMLSIGSRRPNRSTVFWVFVIVAGTVMEVKGELHATTLGLALMTASEVSEAVNLVMTQALLQDSKFTAIEGLYFLAPPSTLCLFGAAAATEWPLMMRSGHLATIAEHPLDFVGAAALGLAVNFVTMLLVQATSSLFTKVLNTFRCVCLVVVGVVVYGEVISGVELVGYSVALIGFAGYNYVQMTTAAKAGA